MPASCTWQQPPFHYTGFQKEELAEDSLDWETPEFDSTIVYCNI
jgi:hypothetical protein